jgi:hypothetical protein
MYLKNFEIILVKNCMLFNQQIKQTFISCASDMVTAWIISSLSSRVIHFVLRFPYVARDDWDGEGTIWTGFLCDVTQKLLKVDS